MLNTGSFRTAERHGVTPKPPGSSRKTKNFEGNVIPQYMALALQPTMRGCRKRSEVSVNIRHISELIDAAVWLSAIDLPVRLICIPEGCFVFYGRR